MRAVTIPLSSTCSLLHRETLVSVSGSVLVKNKLWTKTVTKKEILDRTQTSITQSLEYHNTVKLRLIIN